MSQSNQAKSGPNNPGAESAVTGPSLRRIKVSVCPTTGGRMDVTIPETESVNGLKCLLSRNLRIPTEKITLLYKNRKLDGGSLHWNRITDGSRITLLPNMESGLSVQKAELGVIQALENLSDSQVNDFLSGKAPLLLAMRLGDHMMFVQLQLSTAPCMARRPRQPAVGQRIPSPLPTPSASALPSTTVVNSTVTGRSAQGPPLSPTSLTRASRNLSQKLQELSRMTSIDPTNSTHTCSAKAAEKDSGAVIESMQHHGKGVYSGTFSGTLDPTLQDQDGKPKRDISTIIHILNDLLGANPPLQPQNPCTMPPLRRHHHVPNSNQPIRSQISKTCSGKNSLPLSSKSTDDTEALRGKLQHLQRMMEQRRIRRRTRRGLKSPYQWQGFRLPSHSENSGPQSSAAQEVNHVKPEGMNAIPETVAVSDTAYSSTAAPMEHETVAV